VGWSPNGFTAPQRSYDIDTTVVPLYPRYWVLPVCTEAIEGHVVVDDTGTWHGVRGKVAVRAAALITGDNPRDEYTREAILETRKYPDISFTIDSLVDMSKRGDTLVGTAHGVFYLRDVVKPMTAVVRVWPHGDGLRVLGRLRVPAASLVPEFGLSRYALGLGVGMMIWHYLFMGVDLVLTPEQPAAPH
jgi:hypothetical protein